MKFGDALEKLRNGFSIKLEDDDGPLLIYPNNITETTLDITIEQALSDRWEVHYGTKDYKADMNTLVDLLARLTSVGVQLRSNGEELREIEIITPDILRMKPGFISNYNGKWVLK